MYRFFIVLLFLSTPCWAAFSNSANSVQLDCYSRCGCDVTDEVVNSNMGFDYSLNSGALSSVSFNAAGFNQSFVGDYESPNYMYYNEYVPEFAIQFTRDSQSFYIDSCGNSGICRYNEWNNWMGKYKHAFEGPYFSEVIYALPSSQHTWDMPTVNLTRSRVVPFHVPSSATTGFQKFYTATAQDICPPETWSCIAGCDCVEEEVFCDDHCSALFDDSSSVYDTHLLNWGPEYPTSAPLELKLTSGRQYSYLANYVYAFSRNDISWSYVYYHHADTNEGLTYWKNEFEIISFAWEAHYDKLNKPGSTGDSWHPWTSQYSVDAKNALYEDCLATCNGEGSCIEPCPANFGCVNGNCTHDQGFMECVCEDGYEGQFCETDIDECAMGDDCGDAGTCVDGIGMYTCDCEYGYSGEFCETDIDDCAMGNYCGDAGTCVDGIGTYTCDCDEGYTGVACGEYIETENDSSSMNTNDAISSSSSAIIVEDDSVAGTTVVADSSSLTEESASSSSAVIIEEECDVEAAAACVQAITEPTNCNTTACICDEYVPFYDEVIACYADCDGDVGADTVAMYETELLSISDGISCDTLTNSSSTSTLRYSSSAPKASLSPPVLALLGAIVYFAKF